MILSLLNAQAYCQIRGNWLPGREWANYAFTDEMSIEVGAVFGLNHVWRNKTEQWHEDCIGARKKQGAAVMCWGMISWSWKGPFYVWSAETKEEKAEAAHTIAELNVKGGAEEKRLNHLWRQSEEWKLLRERELDKA